MRAFIAAFALVGVGLLVATDVNHAQDKKTDKDKKEVVLKGLVACNKCELGKSDKCETVLVVKDEKSKKDIIYFFDKASHAKFHDDICSAAKKGTVTGIVTEVDKKKVISAKKVAYD
ncbi:MAG: hypothetical protein EXR98_12650 [Gemmataceae bacterium]|nr:hypothetical protein [Gemmataceae bacterium]